MVDPITLTAILVPALTMFLIMFLVALIISRRREMHRRAFESLQDVRDEAGENGGYGNTYSRSPQYQQYQQQQQQQGKSLSFMPLDKDPYYQQAVNAQLEPQQQQPSTSQTTYTPGK